MPYLQPTLTRTSGGTDIYETNVGNVVQSVSAGTGITVGGTAAVPVINNAGVLSVAAGTGITLTGTAGQPVINAPNPTLIQSWLQNGLTVTTAVGGALTLIPGSQQATAVGQKWLISGSTVLNSTAANAAKVMTIVVQFNSSVNFKYLVNIPESTDILVGKFNLFSLVIDVPTSGDTSFALYAYGGPGGTDGAITAIVDMLTYTRLA